MHVLSLLSWHTYSDTVHVMIKTDPERILSLKEYRCSGGVPNPGHCPNLGHLQKCLDLL